MRTSFCSLKTAKSETISKLVTIQLFEKSVHLNLIRTKYNT